MVGEVRKAYGFTEKKKSISRDFCRRENWFLTLGAGSGAKKDILF